MTIQQHTVRLKLRDPDWKTLGASRIQEGTVSCTTGLTEGVDYAIDYPRGLVRRLRAVSDGLHSFSLSREDNAEVLAAAITAQAAAEADLRTSATAMRDRLTAIIDDPTATDTAAKVRAALVDVARIQRRVLKYLAAEAR